MQVSSWACLILCHMECMCIHLRQENGLSEKILVIVLLLLQVALR